MSQNEFVLSVKEKGRVYSESSGKSEEALLLG